MADKNDSLTIRRGQPADAVRLAYLHKTAIDQGFLSQLPVRFLTLLYRYLIKKELVFVAESKQTIDGFISAATAPSGLMKRFVKRYWLQAGLLLIPVIFRKGFFKKILESGGAGQKSTLSQHENIPELLSIAALADRQSAGIGTSLLSTLVKELRNAGYRQLKVVAGKKLSSANNFYRKNNFEVVAEISIHENEDSYLYLKEL